MAFSQKMNTINNKIKQNKAQYDLDRQTGKILGLSSGNLSKCEFLTGEDVLAEKGLLEKTATIKRFEYSPLGSELRKIIISFLKTQLMLLITTKKMMLRQKMVSREKMMK